MSGGTTSGSAQAAVSTRQIGDASASAAAGDGIQPLAPREPADTPRAVRVRVRGVVQGVGFRPFVLRLAREQALAGWVSNGAEGVEILAEGAGAAIAALLRALREAPPPAARITSIDVRRGEPSNLSGFAIRESARETRPTVRIAPDLPICDACLRELFDPADRRAHYPYINCTNCGPRYSVIVRLPYDRSSTTMAGWPLDEPCAREYADPGDRRFHAQPVACAACGPGYRLEPSGAATATVPDGEPRVSAATVPDRTVVGSSEERRLAVTGRAGHAGDVGQTGQTGQTGDAGHAAHAIHADDRSRASIEGAAALLRDGQIVAIKGIGGYHLACDARNADAVAALRERKFRKEKPFAVMARDLDVARTLVTLSPEAEALLRSPARPIVLAPLRLANDRAADSQASPSPSPSSLPSTSSSPIGTIDLPGIAPGHRDLGVMLPYAPLHHLLFAAGAPDVLVMTSANRSSEPIAYEDDDARRRLQGLADAFLIGERPIVRRLDDSVARAGLFGPVILRRARGYAPEAVATLPSTRPILALGADLKSAIALIVDGQAFVSQHIGDLDQAEALRAFRETIADLVGMYDVRPDDLLIVADAHPEYVSTRYAADLCGDALRGAETRLVQHHRAHVASVLAEREAWRTRVIGLSCDGTGLGDDGVIWGGEIFAGSVADGLARVAHLRPAALAGGDAAARHPVQAAAGFLAQLDDLPDLGAAPFLFPPRYAQARRLVRSGLRTFATTSIGRLFDAAAALLGFTRPVSFEGQAAAWLEQLARGAPGDAAQAYPFPFDGRELDFRPLLQALVSDRLRGCDPPEIARAFQHGIAAGLADAAQRLCETHATDIVVLSGGVFQNELLLADLRDRLQPHGRQVWINHRVPPNDGGICLGQAAIAALAGQEPST